MGSEWREVTIDEVATIKHGFAFKGEYFTDVTQPSVLLTPGNFAIGGGFQTGKPKYYSGPIPTDYVLAEGDLVVTMTDLSKASDTLGYAARVPKTTGTTYLHNQRTGLVQVKDPQVVRAEWLHYLMRTQPYRSWVIGSASGTTVKHTSPSRIGAYAFKLPPIAEQLSAARTLDAVESRIDLLRQTNITLEAIAQALFKSWFVDFDPVHAKAEGRDPEAMDAATAALFPSEFEDSELGLIPKGWRARSLDSVATYLNGLALQKFPAESKSEFLPVIKIAQLRAGNTMGSDRASARLKPEYVVHDGDVLFSWSGSLEVEFWCGGDGALNQHLFKVTSDEVPKWFYYLATRIHLPEFRRVAASKATTMGHIQRKHLAQAKVAVPPPEVLATATKIIAPLLDRRITNSLQMRELTQLRDALLPRLISGKLRLPESVVAAGEALTRTNPSWIEQCDCGTD